MKEVTQSELENLIKTSDKPIIIDFWAEWCAPCRNISPIFEQISNEYQDKAIFCKINTDKNQSLANDFQIQGLPTIIKLYQSQEKLRITGLKNKKELIEKLELNV